MDKSIVGQSEEYLELIKQVNLTEIALLDLEQHREEEVNLPLKVTHKLEIGEEEVTKGYLKAKACFTFRALAKDSDEVQVHIDMTWRISYKLRDESFEVDESVVKEFLRRNIPINLWPYIRETIATLTGKMGLAPLVLPTLRIIR